MLKETIRASERNETLIIKNVGLDLALIIRVNVTKTMYYMRTLDGQASDSKN